MASHPNEWSFQEANTPARTMVELALSDGVCTVEGIVVHTCSCLSAYKVRKVLRELQDEGVILPVRTGNQVYWKMVRRVRGV